MSAADLATTPIAWTPTGDGAVPFRATIGGRRLTIRVNDFPAEPLYTLLVDGVARADLEAWPPAWTRPGRPPGRPAAAITADRLRNWSERLCRLAAGGPAAAAAALGLAGAIVERGGVAAVEPPPPGATALLLVTRDGAIDHLDIRLGHGAPTRAAL
jgi:hypothetical protein